MTAESQTTPRTAVPLFRVEKGHAEPEELAAIAAVILVAAKSRGRPAAHADGRRRPCPGWRLPGYRGPRSWQTPER